MRPADGPLLHRNGASNTRTGTDRDVVAGSVETGPPSAGGWWSSTEPAVSRMRTHSLAELTGSGRVKFSRLVVPVEDQVEAVVDDDLPPRVRGGDGLAVEEDARPTWRSRSPPVLLGHGRCRRGGTSRCHADARLRGWARCPRTSAAGGRPDGIWQQLEQEAGEGSSSSASGVDQSNQDRSRCPGSTRCCCRAGSGPTRRPASNMGTPWESSRVVRKLRCWRWRSCEHGLQVVGGPLDPAVPRPVVALAVVVVLAVGLVVLVVVGDEVVEGEPVVGGHEVDRWPYGRLRPLDS
jgi:hypothetical protein